MNGTSYNQYAPPTATVSDVAPETTGTSELNYWSAKGRIGRLRYIAYSTGASILHGTVTALATGVFGGNQTLLIGSLVALYLALMVFIVLCAIKRCHDLNISGWWCLTVVVPIITLLFVFAPGTKGGNRFGPPPPPNTTGVKVLGYLVPVIFAIGIIAAIALPSYIAYQAKARAPVSQPVGQP